MKLSRRVDRFFLLVDLLEKRFLKLIKEIELELKS